jgi:hypothetical protein
MATNSSLSTIQNVVSATSMFNTFNPLKNIPLFARINLVFVLYVGYLTAGATYCLSNLYQAYQLKFRTPFEVDDQCKLLRCLVLLDEAQEKEKNHESTQPLLQECESLLASIKNRTTSHHDKNKLLLKLVYCYVKNKPDHSYQIAQELSSSYDLFNAAESIQKNYPSFDSAKLNSLFVQAFNAMIQEKESSSEKVSSIYLPSFLRFAKAFHSVNNPELKSRCMANALELLNTFKDGLTQIRALCQIAECYQKIGDLQQRESFIGLAQLLCKKIADADLIQARLAFANAFFSLKEFGKMDQEVGEIMKLMDADHSLLTVKSLYPLTKLIINIEKNGEPESSFKTSAIKPFIDKALEALTDAPQESATKDQAKSYLNIANIYQEGFIDDPDSKEKALSHAFIEIESLSENNDEELKSKIDLLTELTYYYEKDPNKAQEILEILERLYDRCPLDDKLELGTQIVMHYNKAGLKDQAEAFFQKHILNFKNKDEEVFSKISQLVIWANHHDVSGNHYFSQQRKTQLEVAESLLSKLTSSIKYDRALAMIIEGYLQVDRQKSFRLLENYANQRAHQKAMSCVIAATITAITMSVLYFYPQATPVLSLGSAIVRLF